jgi:hypothetical protein
MALLVVNSQQRLPGISPPGVDPGPGSIHARIISHEHDGDPVVKNAC